MLQVFFLFVACDVCCGDWDLTAELLWETSAAGTGIVRLQTHQFFAEDEERCGQQATGGPEVVPIGFFLQIQPGEGDEDGQRDDFLKNPELSDVHDLMTDTVCGDLDQVFEQCDAPADQRGDQPWFLSQVLQVAIPGHGHKDIAEHEESGGG